MLCLVPLPPAQILKGGEGPYYHRGMLVALGGVQPMRINQTGTTFSLTINTSVQGCSILTISLL